MSLRMTRGQIEREQRREAGKFMVWKTDALAALAKASGSSITTMREKEWTRLFVLGKTPEEAAKVAETYQYNARVSGTKRRR